MGPLWSITVLFAFVSWSNPSILTTPSQRCHRRVCPAAYGHAGQRRCAACWSGSHTHANSIAAWPWGRKSIVSGELTVLRGPPEGRRGRVSLYRRTVRASGFIWCNPWINDKTNGRFGSRSHTRGGEPPKESNIWWQKEITINIIRSWLPIGLHWTVHLGYHRPFKGWKCIDMTVSERCWANVANIAHSSSSVANHPASSFKLHLLYKPGPLPPLCPGCRLSSVPGSSH